jgi:hypothetical protein
LHTLGTLLRAVSLCSQQTPRSGFAYSESKARLPYQKKTKKIHFFARFFLRFFRIFTI